LIAGDVRGGDEPTPGRKKGFFARKGGRARHLNRAKERWCIPREKKIRSRGRFFRRKRKGRSIWEGKKRGEFRGRFVTRRKTGPSLAPSKWRKKKKKFSPNGRGKGGIESSSGRAEKAKAPASGGNHPASLQRPFGGIYPPYCRGGGSQSVRVGGGK